MTIRMQECRDESEIYDYHLPTDLTFEYNKFILKNRFLWGMLDQA